MAALVQKSAELFVDSGSSISPSLSGCTAGNHATLLVAQSGSVAGFVFSAPSGWTAASTPVGANSGASFNPSAAIFYKENISSGVQSATVTLTTGGYASASIVECSGLLTSGSLGPVSANQANSGTSGNTGTTSATTATGISFALCHPEDSAGVNSLSSPAATGYTVVETEATSAVHVAYDFSYQVLGSTGTQTASWTWSSSSAYNNIIVVFYDAVTGPVITADPTVQTANEGATATFSYSATGVVSQQWQDNSGGSFADISGATGSTYTTPAATFAMQGRLYRVVATNGGGSVTSGSAGLRVTWGSVTPGPRSVPLFGAAPFGAGAFGSSAENPTAGGPTTYNLVMAEAATAVDALSSALIAAVVATEVAAAADTTSASATAAVTTAETAAAADTTNATKTASAAVAEAATALDAQAAAMVAARAVAEAATSLDAPTAGLVAPVAVNEAAAAVDAASTGAVFAAAIAEVGSATDAQASALTAALVISEAAAASDFQATGTVFGTTINEAAVAIDAQALSAQFAVVAAESGAATDAQAAQKVVGLSLLEAAVAADAQAAQAAASVGVLEAAAATDVQAAAAIAQLAIAEVAVAIASQEPAGSIVIAMSEICIAVDASTAALLGALVAGRRSTQPAPAIRRGMGEGSTVRRTAPPSIRRT